MAGEIQGVIANTVARMEAITCDAEYDGTTAFVHDVEALDFTDLGHSRAFCVVDTGKRERGGTMGTDVSPSEMAADLEVQVAYARGAAAYALGRVVSADIDRVKHELERTSGYDQTSAANLWMREVDTPTYLRSEDDDGPIIVIFPVRCTYRPTF